jgi:predicted permease
LTLLLQVLSNNILPAFIVMGVGFLLDRTLKPHLMTISRLALYGLSPCLVFTALVESQLEGGDMLAVVAYATVVILGMVAIASLTARLLRLNQATSSAFVLGSTLVNAGNFGLSVILYAYGETGLQFAVVFFVASAVISNTVGAFIASRSQGNWRQSLRSVLRLPLLYAAILAVALRLANLVPPRLIMRPLDTIAQAAVPTMLLLLGMQLSRTRLQHEKKLVLLASAQKLVVMAGLALAVGSLFGLPDVARRVCIVEASTPTAVTASVLATEFDSRPDLIASTIFLSTLASAFTLTIIISLLG